MGLKKGTLDKCANLGLEAGQLYETLVTPKRNLILLRLIYREQRYYRIPRSSGGFYARATAHQPKPRGFFAVYSG